MDSKIVLEQLEHHWKECLVFSQNTLQRMVFALAMYVSPEYCLSSKLLEATC